jgi:hypothetical protein
MDGEFSTLQNLAKARPKAADQVRATFSAVAVQTFVLLAGLDE